jgi:hypothetical protein
MADCTRAGGDHRSVVLLDAGQSGRIDLGVTIAHELGHAFGVEHSDGEGPCANALVEPEAPGTIPLNLMGRAVHSQVVPDGFPLDRITLADVTVSDAQVRAARHWLD